MDSRHSIESFLNDAFRYACALTHDRTIAEDLVQEACVSIQRSGADWNRGALFLAVRHRHIDSLRANHRAEIALRTLTNGAHAVQADEPSTPRFQTERIDIESALGRLRSAEREILYLSIAQGYTAAQISRLTNQPRSTVLSLMQRARAKLAEALRAVDHEVSP